MPDPLDTPAGPLTVARAGAADVDTVLDVTRAAAAWLTSRGSDQWAYYLTDDAAALVAGRVADHEVYLVRRAADAAPVATFCLQWSDLTYWPDDGGDGTAGYVHQLAVDPAFAGRGVGAALLAWAAARIRAAGRRRFRLDCLAANAGLCAYYERQGFRRAGTVQPHAQPAQRWERDV